MTTFQPNDKVQYVPQRPEQFAQPGVVRAVVGTRALVDWAITAPSWVLVGWLEPYQARRVQCRVREPDGTVRYATEIR